MGFVTARDTMNELIGERVSSFVGIVLKDN
jgi:hypothetical protein